jgi:hypothetical protein
MDAGLVCRCLPAGDRIVSSGMKSDEILKEMVARPCLDLRNDYTKKESNETKERCKGKNVVGGCS